MVVYPAFEEGPSMDAVIEVLELLICYLKIRPASSQDILAQISQTYVLFEEIIQNLIKVK